jgi:hypothetical protein
MMSSDSTSVGTWVRETMDVKIRVDVDPAASRRVTGFQRGALTPWAFLRALLGLRSGVIIRRKNN